MTLSPFQSHLLDRIEKDTSSKLDWLINENYHYKEKLIQVLHLIQYLEKEKAITFTRPLELYQINPNDLIEVIANTHRLDTSLMDTFHKLRYHSYTKTPTALQAIKTNSRGNETIIKKIDENTKVNENNGKTSSRWSWIMFIVGLAALGISTCSLIKTSYNSDKIENIKMENQQLINDKKDLEFRLMEIENAIKKDSIVDRHNIH